MFTVRKLLKNDIGQSDQLATLCIKLRRKCLCKGSCIRNNNNSQLYGILFLCLFPMVCLLGNLTKTVHEDSINLEQDTVLMKQIIRSLEIAVTVHHIQLERGQSLLYLNKRTNVTFTTLLDDDFKSVHLSLEHADTWDLTTSGDLPPDLRSFSKLKMHLDDFRARVIKRNTTMKEIIIYYTDINNALVNLMTKVVEHSQSSTIVAYNMVTLSKEQAGIEEALGSVIYLTETFSMEDLLWYNEKKTMGDAYLSRAEQYSPKIKRLLNTWFRGSILQNDILSMREEILHNKTHGSPIQHAVNWTKSMTKYITILKRIQDTIGQDIINLLDNEMWAYRQELVISVLTMVIAFALLPIVVLLVYKMTKKIQVCAYNLQEKTKCLEIERKRSEKLLYQMLPVTVARKLLQLESVMPEYYSSVTVYFSDIVDFTTICCQSTPMQVIDMLNLIYKTFDDRLELYDVYKVETIGDAYMVASGLPQKNGDRHVIEICFLALDTLDTIYNLQIPHLPEEKLKIRVGLNTGPVVAGVVGNKMPRYCLFGETVNVASRMESSGQPLKIQISPSTKKGLDVFPGFLTEERGLIVVKGKGVMKTYWLTGKRSDCVYEAKIRT